MPLAAGITAGIGNLTIKFTSTFSITGIATGTLIVIIGYHAVRPFAHRSQDRSQAHSPGAGQPVPAEDGPGGSPDPDTRGAAP